MKSIACRTVVTLILAMTSPAVAIAESYPKTVEFSGYTWEIRRSDGLEGPGPNRFLDNRRTVWSDDEGDLHLRIWSRLGMWFSAEVVLTESLGYGTYVFETVGNLDDLDPPVILGMFTYDHDPAFSYREIDIEFGLFGSADGPNAQFVVQPFEEAGNRQQFTVDLEGTHLTHAFIWSAEEIIFASFHGHRASEVLVHGVAGMDQSIVLGRWVFTGQVPPPGNERVHINLWLYESAHPTRDHEVIFRSFTYLPPLP